MPHPILSGATAATGWVGRAAGVVAGIATLILAAAVLLGIALRALSIDNTWAYDLDHFTLVWLAFVGAAYTGYKAAHVTAGISLEHVLGRGAILLVIVRFILVAGFLAVFAWAGYQQVQDSWLFNEKTLDAIQWPMWAAKLSLPVGALAWLVGELHQFLTVLADRAKPASAK